MRRSIYLHSVMCVCPDAVKRHVDLSLSGSARGGVEDDAEPCFSAFLYSTYTKQPEVPLVGILEHIRVEISGLGSALSLVHQPANLNHR